MSQDVQSQVIVNIKESNFFAIQLDESTDITEKAQLVAFSRFVCNGDIIEQFLFFKPLPEITKGQDSLVVVNSYISSHNLSWKSFISICTDCAPSMSGSLKGFVILVKQKKPGTVFIHCFLHREALISKSAVPEVQKVLDETIIMVNCSYIRSRPLQSKLFLALCSATEGMYCKGNCNLHPIVTATAERVGKVATHTVSRHSRKAVTQSLNILLPAVYHSHTEFPQI
jgi:hypothetical protein